MSLNLKLRPRGDVALDHLSHKKQGAFRSVRVSRLPSNKHAPVFRSVRSRPMSSATFFK